MTETAAAEQMRYFTETSQWLVVEYRRLRRVPRTAAVDRAINELRLRVVRHELEVRLWVERTA